MALNSTDTVYIREQLHRIDEAIAQTDEYLAELRKLIDFYTRRRDAQVKTRKSCAALLSPLRNFPVELLGHIFIFACEESRKMRWIVSHVCRWWRCAAITMSELWTAALMPLSVYTTGSKDEKGQEYVETCIRRSNSRRMKWECLEDQDFDIPSQSERISPFLRTTPCEELLWIACGRGDDTILDVFHLVLLDIVASSSETLSSMTIRTADPEGYWWRSLPPGLALLPLEKFMRLQKLHLFTIHPVPYESISVTWANITDISIETPVASYPLIQDILAKCCALKYCEFSIDRFDNLAWDAHRGPFILRHLQKLRLNSLRQELFYRILDTLQAPALTDLIVESKRFADFVPMPLQKFLSYCCNTLRRLWIAPIFGHEIRDIIAPMVPSLEELGIMLHRNNVPDPLGALHVSTHHETLLPHLRALTVVSLPSSNLYSDFMCIVENRGKPPVQESPSWFRNDLPRLIHMRLYQHDPDWNYEDIDLEHEQCWQKFSPDYFEVRFARAEREFKANFLTSSDPEWPSTKEEI